MRSGAGPGLAFGFLVLIRCVHADPAVEATVAVPDSSLDRYFQWGFYDSLEHAVSPRLQNPDLPPAEASRLHAYLGVVRFSQHRASDGRDEFRLAACADTARLLDVYYLTPEMRAAYGDARRANPDSAHCPQAPAASVSAALPPPRPLPPPEPAPPPPGRAFPARTFGLSVSFGLAAGLAAWAGWEFYRESDTYSQIENAGNSGDTAAYYARRSGWRGDLSDERRNLLWAGGGALFCAAVGTGFALWAPRTSLRAEWWPHPSAVWAWNF